MNQGFKVFPREVREEVVKMFEHRFDTHNRGVDIDVTWEDGWKESHHFCPIGACLLKAGFAVPTYFSRGKGIPDNRYDHRFADKNGVSRGAYAPSSITIKNFLDAAGIDYVASLGYTNHLVEFYRDWDTGLISDTDLRHHLIEEEP